MKVGIKWDARMLSAVRQNVPTRDSVVDEGKERSVCSRRTGRDPGTAFWIKAFNIYSKEVFVSESFAMFHVAQCSVSPRTGFLYK